jgi:hypothetical protein
MVATGLATMVLVIAFAYMAAQFFRRPEYESFATMELYQVGVSAVMFAVIFSSSCFVSEISDALAGGDMFDLARGYLDYLVNQIALPAVLRLQGTLFAAQWISSLSMRFGASVWGIMFPAFPSFVLIERTIEFLLVLITPFTSSLIVQMAILEFVRGTMIPFVLPAGVILRIFPPTREAGAFMIAVALGFQIVFPFTYVMHGNIVAVLINDTTHIPQDMSTYMNAHGFGLVASTITETGLFDPMGMIFHPLYYLSYILLQALFLPALSMTITVAFIKSMTKFISQKLG